MANRWVRTNHPQPVTLDNPRMKFALMTTMIAFLAFAALIVWFRYYVERIAQKIAVMHVQKMGALASVVLPAVFFSAAVGNRLASPANLYAQRLHLLLGSSISDICCF